MYSLIDQWDLSVGHLVFPTCSEGEAVNFVYLSHLGFQWVDRDLQNISYSSTRISKLTQN